ncbi:DsbA family oxidoreductase [Sporolactobacillus sp. STSJ-5]|uniref:DsbA family oxidoreductase n=1 Tax=Sporolactobacillus sp. STSJ-5 TaxID=2965076 RepID=UPI00210572D6|nr:DsbA family oxidoreductase [Sporolactobacillus sp. STSJ-5]MCQ2010964.1 DsbA family oxidoreductase [Sporolactobacillus sp. STSJ-5]
MKIEVWSDIACPFCYIGKHRLEKALSQFPHKEQVEVEFKSFELDPNAPISTEKSIYEKLAANYGISIEQAKQNVQGVTRQAASVGLTFNFDEMKLTNTFNAHRLIKWAKIHGKEATITEKLFRAHFTESKNLGSLETLADLAEASGLERNEALTVLHDKNLYADDVRSDEDAARQFGISGVPFFIINRKYAISGAQPTDTFTAALQQVWEEENPASKLQILSSDSGDDVSCADGHCIVPQKK